MPAKNTTPETVPKGEKSLRQLPRKTPKIQYNFIYYYYIQSEDFIPCIFVNQTVILDVCLKLVSVDGLMRNCISQEVLSDVIVVASHTTHLLDHISQPYQYLPMSALVGGPLLWDKIFDKQPGYALSDFGLLEHCWDEHGPKKMQSRKPSTSKRKTGGT